MKEHHMKQITFLLLLAIGTAEANDGMYLSRGGVIYPTQETRISLAKEVLSFTCREGRCAVDVLFEFMNPDPVERVIQVGFQAPSSVGDVPDTLSAVTQIEDMKVMSDGKLLPFVQKAAECEECPLEDPSRFSFAGDNPGVFVSLFEVVFQPGITRIQHSYSFPASSHVYFDQIYNYILRTGAKWANAKIADLTVFIDMGPNAYFYVNDVFGPTAEWNVLGTGKLTSTTFDQGAGTMARMVRILSGRLMVTVKDLRPEENIEFGIVTVGSFFDVPTELSGLTKQVAAAIRVKRVEHGDPDQPSLTKDDLRLLRNIMYARYGYAFKDAELRKRFDQYAWYIPDPGLQAEQIPFSESERRFLAEIVRKEKE